MGFNEIVEGNGRENSIVQMATDYDNVLDVDMSEFVLQAYKGSGGFRSGRYLVGYHMETQESLDERKILNEYPNYLKPIVNSTMVPIFTEESERTEKGETISSEDLSLFVNDPTGNSTTNLDSFIHKMLLMSTLQAVSFCVVENYADADFHATEKENISNRVLPYVYQKKITDVLIVDGVRQISFDKFGGLDHVIFTDHTEENEDGDKVNVYRYWSKDETYLLTLDDKEKVTVGGSVVNLNMSTIPVIPLYTSDIDSVTSGEIISIYHDIAKKCFTLYNQVSDISALFRKQGYSLFYASGLEDGAIVGGANNFINLAEGTTMPPGFASPDSAIPKTMMENKKESIAEIYKLASQHGIKSDSALQSGVSKEWDFRAENSVLLHNVQLIESFEKKIIKIFSEYVNKDFDYNVSYCTNFAPQSDKNTLDSIDIAINNIGVNMLAAAEMRNKATQLILVGDISEEKLEEIKKYEIEHTAQEINSENV